MPSCYYYDEQSNRCSCYGNDSLNELLDENAKLRDELENARMRGDDLASSISEWRAVTEARGQTIDRLAAENAKLRELVKSMYYDLTHMTFPPDWVTDYEADMRELRVEVTS